MNARSDTAIRVAMGQILVEFGEPQRNLARAIAAIRQAAQLECRIVILPECLDLGWTFPKAMEHAQPIPGPRSDALAEAAARFGITVVAGLTEKDGQRTFNSAVILDDQGMLLAKHRKINELDIARHLYATGDRLAVVHTPLGIVGSTICADNSPDTLELGHALGRMGCQILASPCAWAVDADHDNAAQPYGDLWIRAYSELARSHQLAVIGVSSVGWLTDGPWKGKKCIGASLAVGPDGCILARGPYGEDAEAVVPIEVPIVHYHGASPARPEAI
ncbi:MAG: carbon-nitrogen hydrolase family protein [Chthonomonadales bacterium]